MASGKPGEPGDLGAIPEAIRDGFVPWDVPHGTKPVTVGGSRISVASSLVVIREFRKENRDRAKVLWHRPSRKTWIVAEHDGMVFSIKIPDERREWMSRYCEAQARYLPEYNRAMTRLKKLRDELAAYVAEGAKAEFTPGPEQPPGVN